MVAHLFDERNGAVERMVEMAIEAAHRAGKKIGICGQAPSDYPEFARFLVERGITSISLNPDTVIQTTQVISEAEAKLSNVPREPPEKPKLTKTSATETSHRSCDQNKVLAQQ
jgi:pyruvate,water dikinase